LRLKQTFSVNARKKPKKRNVYRQWKNTFLAVTVHSRVSKTLYIASFRLHGGEVMNVPFFGRIAHIDLTRKTVTTETVGDDLYQKIIGGKGLGVYLLMSHLKPDTNPLSPDNILIIANGPLTGSSYPNTSRVELITKSPLTGTFLDSSAGGYLGREIKATGWDAIVIKGRAKELTYLYVHNQTIEFRDGSSLRGLSPKNAEENIRKECPDDRMQILSIGSAGENLILFANVDTGGRHFGRGGAGAVMGSKNLKAIAFRGTHSLPWNEDKDFKKLAKGAYQKIVESPLTKKGGVFYEIGTHFTIGVVNSFGVFPTKNWQQGIFEDVKDIWPETFTDMRKRHVGCYRCPISCRRLTRVGIEENSPVYDGPEYESIYALGSNCGINQADSVVKLDYLCSKYGLDSISTGVTLSFLIECYEKGLISSTDLGGLTPAFGQEEELAQIIEDIVFKKGIGTLLSQGTARAAKEIGGGSHSFAMQVKGLELPGYDPRGMKAMALLYATADRGGCHVRGSTLRSELLGMPDPIDRLSYEGKAALVVELQKEYTLLNSLQVCLFANFGLSFEDYADVFNYLFSNDFSIKEFKNAGSRIWNLTRLFNCREGFDREDDKLPDRLFKDPVPMGPSEGQVIDKNKFEQMKDEYYQIQGWDIKTGKPILDDKDIL
jgi:aldehyde:ferredoxin oxidoreductase